MRRTSYTRWTAESFEPDATLTADLLGIDVRIEAAPTDGTILFAMGGESRKLTPDEARLYGVRLIEAAAFADAHRAIRVVTTGTTRPAH